METLHDGVEEAALTATVAGDPGLQAPGWLVQGAVPGMVWAAAAIRGRGGRNASLKQATPVAALDTPN